MTRKHAIVLGSLVAALFTAVSAHAYMGPGAGLGMLGSVLAVIVAVLVAVLGVILLPVRMLLKRRRKGSAAG